MKKVEKTHFDVIVIGGGPAGMMAAGHAGEHGKSVLLLEKNKTLGKKLDMTGGGRCNITNAEYDVHEFLKHYSTAKNYLYSPFSRFGVKNTFEFFESHELPLVVEARKRAFPNTQKATDVSRVMKQYIADNHVTVKMGAAVGRVTALGGKIVSVSCGACLSENLPAALRRRHGARSQATRYTADNFIITTGGYSRPETGSTGDGFKWLKELGHTVAPGSPNIVPLAVKDAWVKKLSGISLSFMKITFFQNGNPFDDAQGKRKKAFSKKGKLLFTHFGLSGPLILNSAKQVSELLEGGEVTAEIDMYPDTDFADLERSILKTIDANKNKNLKNFLDALVPHGTDPAILMLWGLPDVNIKAHSITKEDRKRLVHILKGAPLAIKGLMGYDRAVVSDGGVSLDEVDTKTMRSRLYPNLYFAGDILNINRPSGGYSLQLCWTTGFVAGDSV
ncbi:MAG: aminoacetone oxidase family FAD-binding enzyme [bacterium]|nr:aminoacetone oxidase family FAD-binding enzyme [bacterium]